MVRTVIQFRSDGNSDRFMLSSPLGVFPQEEIDSPLGIDGNDPDLQALRGGAMVPDRVRRVGTKLEQRLLSNAAVRNALDAAAAQAALTPGGAALCFDTMTSTADDLPWECLCRSEFYSLSTTLPPVARIATSARAPRVADRAFTAPLKIVIVLAAAQVKAQAEWDSLRSALENPLFQAIPRALRIFVAELDLLETIKVWAAGQADVSVQPLSERSVLISELQKGPHLLHFFCHGQALPTPHLRLATPTNWRAGQGSESIVVEVSTLSQINQLLQSVWLITLNCCESAAPGPGAKVLSRELVRAGFPAVIGMRDKIETDFAAAFSGALYNALLNMIQKCLSTSGTNAEVEWASALTEPRQQLCAKSDPRLPIPDAARNCTEWTLPVLYVLPDVMSICTPAAPGLSDARRQQLRGELKAVRGLRDQQARNGNPEFVDFLDKKIKELEDQLFG